VRITAAAVATSSSMRRRPVAAAAAAAVRISAHPTASLARQRACVLNQFHTGGEAGGASERGVIGACLFDHDGSTALIISQQPRSNICNRDQRQMNPFYGLAPNLQTTTPT